MHICIIILVYLHITCSFTIQQKEMITKSYIKNEVLGYMISKSIKYNLNKKLQTYFVGQPSGLQFTQQFFRNQCILPIEDDINVFTIVTV